MAGNSHKVWQCILYTESAKDNWLSVLNESKYRIAVSPVHDHDINEETGEIKKAHYHINMQFAKGWSFDEVLEFIATFGGVLPEYVRDKKVMDEYLIHYNNPEKAQYNYDDIKLLNGYKFAKGSFMNDDSNLDEIERIIFDENITNYAFLISYMKYRKEYSYLLPTIRKNVYHISTIIKEKREKTIVDKNKL